MKAKFQNLKKSISQFLGQTHRKFCPERKFQPPLLSNVLWSYTLGHTLSNAFSTTFIRHPQRAVSAFKHVCNKSNFPNSCFGAFQKTQPTQEEFRHHKIIFVFLKYYVNNNLVDHAFESFFMFTNETHVLKRSLFLQK